MWVFLPRWLIATLKQHFFKTLPAKARHSTAALHMRNSCTTNYVVSSIHAYMHAFMHHAYIRLHESFFAEGGISIHGSRLVAKLTDLAPGPLRV